MNSPGSRRMGGEPFGKYFESIARRAWITNVPTSPAAAPIAACLRTLFDCILYLGSDYHGTDASGAPDRRYVTRRNARACGLPALRASPATAIEARALVERLQSARAAC